MKKLVSIEYKWIDDTLHWSDGNIGKFVGGVTKVPNSDCWDGWLWDGAPTSKDCGRFTSREQAQLYVVASHRKLNDATA